MKGSLVISTLVFFGQEQGDDTSIKIADFGFAKKVPRPNCLRTLCGTAQYVAPEVLELKDTGYDTRADMWSVGVVVYILLGGYAPFEGPVDLLAQAIISGEYEFHEKYWDEISTDAKDMISNLLQVNPEIRLTADDALQSPWMILEDEALNTKDLSGAQRALKDKAKEPGPPAPVRSSSPFEQLPMLNFCLFTLLVL
jgi:serine/threonine protein kinase